MPFTQECLQCGYLLSGDDSLRGQTVRCPRCQQGITIERLDEETGYGLSELPPEEQAEQDARMNPPEAGGDFNIRTKKRRRGGGGGGRRHAAERVGNFTASDGSGIDLQALSSDPAVQVPCPNGHLLETTKSMMGQWAMCPHCGEQFEMLYANTAQYRADRQRSEERQIARSGSRWLMWSVIAVVGAVLFLIILIAVSSV